VTAVARRLGELASRYDLDEAAVRCLAALLSVLADDSTAPSSVRAPAEAVDTHVADSLVALELPATAGARELADLGSGAGFPGLPLAAALPAARVRLVESNARKCAYLKRAAARAGIANAEIVHARAETWDEGRETCDLVMARALASLSVVAEYAAPLLRETGVLIAWKGRRDAREEADGAFAAGELGLEPVEIRPVRPFATARERHLHLLRKVAPTPPRYPRRPGMAAKRPLRAG
jgi:16S rRNA (guanine527-N7)-methyltransferase